MKFQYRSERHDPDEEFEIPDGARAVSVETMSDMSGGTKAVFVSYLEPVETDEDEDTADSCPICP